MHGGNGEVLSKASQYGTGRGRESPERGLFAEMVDAVSSSVGGVGAQQRRAKAVLEARAVAGREDAGQGLGLDLDREGSRPWYCVHQRPSGAEAGSDRGLARRPDRATTDPAGQMAMLCVHAAIPTLLAVREPEPFRADA